VALRAGIIGAGNIFGRGYLPALLETDALRVAAVCDLDPGRAQEAATALGGAAIAATAAGLVERDDLDAVLVLTPTHTHADLAVAALEAGKHVLCEKPMARSAADARRMAEAADRSHRRILIGHTRRFDERWTTIHEQIRAGRIGEPVYLYRSEHAWNGAPGDAWQWRNDEGGGALWDVGIHIAELIHWYFGERPRTVFTRVLHARPEAQAGGAPDAAIVTFDCGPLRHAVLSVSWIHPPAWGPFYATTEIVGTAGRLESYDLDDHPTIVASGTELAIPRYSPLLSATSTAFRREIEHFVRAIEQDAPFVVTPGDAIVAVELLEAAERSAASGRPEAVAR
jgi:UDP-N-acetylglucosamine 3-dehydrogenase